MKNKVLVMGAGNIGTLVTTLFAKHPSYEVYLSDINIKNSDYFKSMDVRMFQVNVLTDSHSLQKFIREEGINTIVSALPFSCNTVIAEMAAKNGVHYFDLTEDVRVKDAVKTLSKQYNDSIMMPQCGLAPGMINILGADLIRQFDKVQDVKIRVGALPQNVSNSLKYTLTWSTNGLVNEYIQPCEAIVNGMYMNNLKPLTEVEEISIDGVEYEAFTTSGGLSTLAETFAGQVVNLDYKTIRYPGHCEKMKFLLQDLRLSETPELAEDILEKAIPTTEDDVIIIYGSATGIKNGEFLEKVYTNKVFPKTLHNRKWTGIQVTTAAGICAAVDLTVGVKNGFVKQEDISLNDFLGNYFGSLYVGNSGCNKGGCDC